MPTWVYSSTDIGLPGKTVLASIIINACKERQQDRIAYFYCRHDDDSTTSCVNILKGLLTQQVGWYPNLVPFFNEQREEKGEVVLRSEKTAKTLLRAVSEEGDRQFIVIDGLDECLPQERKSILTFLQSLVEKIDDREPSKLRLLIISQDEFDIRKLLSGAREFRIQATHNAADIDLFVQTWTKKIRSKFDLDEGNSDYIQRQTCTAAAGGLIIPN